MTQTMLTLAKQPWRGVALACYGHGWGLLRLHLLFGEVVLSALPGASSSWPFSQDLSSVPLVSPE